MSATAPPGTQLAARWQRGRLLLVVALGVVPFLQFANCAALGFSSGAVWAAIPAAAALILGVVQLGWVVRKGNTDPSNAGRIAFLAGGATVLVGLIPSVGLAGGWLAGVLFVVGAVLFVASVALAFRGHRTMMTPLVPELGSMPVRLRIATRSAVDAADLISSSLVLDLDRISWTARRHRANGGPQVDATVPFQQLCGARPITLPTQQPRLSLPDGTVLLAPPGPAIVLATTAGERMIPVHDAALVVGLVERRVAKWQTEHA
ncbi:hypothetical protein [Saccharopolyspora sp. NPDC002376]